MILLLSTMLAIVCISYIMTLIKLNRTLTLSRSTITNLGTDLAKTKRDLYVIQKERDILALKNSEHLFVKKD